VRRTRPPAGPGALAVPGALRVRCGGVLRSPSCGRPAL